MIPIALALAAVIAFHLWSGVVANAFGDWGEWDYYRLLVRGFRQGNLYLDQAPAPELVALPDPYDPVQNAPYRMGDASYYKGRYYLYFGVAPAAVLMLPVTLLTGWEMTTGVANYVFCLVALGTMIGLWLAIRARYFADSAAWVGAVGVLGIGSATHLLTLLRRPMWWELAISAGIAFTFLALVAVYRAIHGSRPRIAMAMAGLCLGLAVASRPVCLFATAMLIAPLWLAWRRRRDAAGGAGPMPGRTPWWQLALAAAIPLAACGLALMAYNYARFDNPLEFGQNYQLSGAYESKLSHFRLAYVPHNAWAVFLQPLRWTWEFPFAEAWADPADVPGYMGSEEIAGLVRTFPFVALVLLVPLCWRGRARAEIQPLRATLGAIAGYFVPVCLLVLCFFATTARYIADFASPLALLAGCGLLGLERALRVQGRRASRILWHALVTPLLLAGAAMGAVLAVWLSFDYHSRAPMRQDPPRWEWHERTWREAIGRAGVWLGLYAGPVVLPVKFAAQPPGTTETLWRSSGRGPTERVLVEHVGPAKLRFGYTRANNVVRWSAAHGWTPGRAHRVELQLPSLHGPADRWVDGFRRGDWFRERSAVAVWMDGERVLATVVAPWKADGPAGGSVAQAFSGKVGWIRRRLLRADELPGHGAGDWVVAGPAPAPGQPPVPLVTTGKTGAANALALACIAPGSGRLSFEGADGPPVMSPEFALPATDRLTVEIEQGPAWPWSATPGEAQTLGVWINGRLVWETPARWHASAPEEVFLARNPVGAASCAPQAAGWAPAEPWARGAGGTLRYRLVFPEPVSAVREPLIAVGALYQSDIVGVRGGGASNEAQVFFEHFPAPIEHGAIFQFVPGRLETVEITLPSFNPERFGEPASGDVHVRINRQSVLRVNSACHLTLDTGWNMGRNRFGSAHGAPAFRGWLLDARWMGVMEQGDGRRTP